MNAVQTVAWQVRRPGGRRILTGMSRAQVQRALQRGKLRADDLALPPGADGWMTVSAALERFPEPTPAAGPPAAPAVQLNVPQWAPMEQEGRLRRGDDEEEDPADMDMTAMIDVTTLLLIFFLIGGVFMLQTQVALPQAASGTPEMAAELKPVALVIDLDPENPAGGKLRFEDQPASSLNLEELPEQIERKVQEGYLREVTLKAHRHVPFGLVRQTMVKLHNMQIDAIKVAIEQPRGR